MSKGGARVNGYGLGVDDDDRRADLCPVEQRSCTAHALEPDAPVRPAVAGSVLRRVVDALTTAERHEVGHVHVVERADLVGVLGVDPKRSTSGGPGASAITGIVAILGAVSCRHLHDDAVVLKSHQLP